MSFLIPLQDDLNGGTDVGLGDDDDGFDEDAERRIQEERAALAQRIEASRRAREEEKRKAQVHRPLPARQSLANAWLECEYDHTDDDSGRGRCLPRPLRGGILLGQRA